ncbi:MAG: aminotransferase class I/II-fold pyridoxal phosphate-dependent enzyme [Devosia sp.]
MSVASINIERSATVREALAKLDATGRGILLLLAEDGTFLRTVTDGDLRRLLLGSVPLEGQLTALPEAKSVTIAAGYTRRDALELMQQRGINHLPVVDTDNRVVDLVERSHIDQQVLLSTPHMGDTELDFVAQAFQTNWIAPLGPNVDAFERELADKVGAGHAVALSSGTAAIHLSLVMLGVGPGDLVFCSTLTFAASANPIVYQGAEPVFIDSEPESWNMSPAALEQAFDAAKAAGRLPKAVLVVSLYGQSANMDPIAELCERYGVPLVEDAAESLGARYKGRASGTFGLMGIYSFNGNKIITTSGGGMLVTEDENLAKQARFYATQARDPAPHYQHSKIGYNYRMSNILAGVGRGQLRVLDQRVEARRQVFSTYRAMLADVSWLHWMPEPNWSYSTHWLSVATLAPDAPVTATELIGSLSAEFIEARPVWKPMHLQPVFADRQYFHHGENSVSDDLFNRGICLPSGSNLSGGDVERVVIAIRRLA